MSIADAEPFLLSQRDLDFTPDDGNLYEVINGVLHVTPFPGYAHQNAVTELLRILGNHVHRDKLGKVFASGLKVVLAEPTGVGPDIVFVATEHMGHMRDDGFYGAPDLVVEVLSSKPQLDRFVKRQAYASAGIANYWIVDPQARSLEALRLEGDRYRSSQRRERRERVRTRDVPRACDRRSRCCGSRTLEQSDSHAVTGAARSGLTAARGQSIPAV